MFIELGTITIYGEWQGLDDAGGPPLVFLHDGLGSVRAWGDIPERICARLGAKALVFDRWGYGRSSERVEFPDGFLEEEAARFGRLLDALDLERVRLVGHSDGASIALLFASEHPERVVSLVAEAPHTFVEPEAQEGIRRHLAPRLGDPAPDWLRSQHGERAGRLLEAWTRRWLSPRQRSWDMRDRLKGITCPILVVQGDADEYATLAQVDTILAETPNAVRWVLPDCGHVPHAGSKEDFVRRVGQFLKGLAGDSARADATS